MTLKHKHPIAAKSIIGAALFALALPLASSAQEVEKGTEEVAAKPATFGVSVNGGLSFSFTDVKSSKTAPVLGIGGHYFATRYLHVNVDIQKGWLKGGEPVNTTTTLMGFENNYFYGSVTARFFPVALMKNANNDVAISLLSGIYGGTGLGFLSSDVKANDIKQSDYGSLVSYSGANFLIPLEVGFNLPVAKFSGNKKLSVNLNYRVNFCFTDKIDGYVPTVAANEKNDAYNQLTAGLMLSF